MWRETDQNLRKVTFCDGKRGKFFEKSFPAAGKGKNASENGFVRREKEDNLAKRLSAAE